MKQQKLSLFPSGDYYQAFKAGYPFRLMLSSKSLFDSRLMLMFGRLKENSLGPIVGGLSQNTKHDAGPGGVLEFSKMSLPVFSFTLSF